jgi:hypothetical protein
MFGSRAQTRIRAPSGGYFTINGPISAPQIASVVAQLAEWLFASHSFQTGSSCGVKSRR